MYGNLKLASLDAAALAQLKQLEEEIGKHIMALEPGVAFAKLSAEELQKIDAFEKETGVTLLVYDKLD